MSKFNTGQSFADGDTVTGAKLNNITSQLNIYTGVISEQTAMSATVSTLDQLLIADTDNGDSGAANRITVQKLFDDSLTNGTYTTANLSGTITSNRTVATSATITTGTIPTLVSNNATIGTTTGTAGVFTSGTITTGLIPTLTAGTTTGTAGIFTSGTIATLNSTTGTITNLSTTLAGDFTISQGTGTIGTSKVTPANLLQPFTRATAVASTSGTAIDFTGIPSWAKRITVAISGLSASGNSANLLRVGTSSGFVTSGYTSGVTVQGATNVVASANNTNGFNFSPTPADVAVACGILTLLNISGNTWVHASVVGFTNDSYSATGGGNIALSGTLDRVRITTVNGTDTFDAGSINIMYEG